MKIIQQLSNRVCNGNNENQLLQWAVIAAFFVLIGDFIAFILAVIATQDSSNSNNCCSVQAHVKSLEEKITQKNYANQEIIKILEEKLNELKTTI